MIQSSRNSVSLFFLIISLFSGVAMHASAQTIVYEYTDQHLGVKLGPTDQSITNASPDITQVIPQFDPSLGTLTGINVWMDIRWEITGTAGPSSSGGKISGGMRGWLDWAGSAYIGEWTGDEDFGPPNTQLNAGFRTDQYSVNLISLDQRFHDDTVGTGTLLWQYRSQDSLGLYLDASDLGTATGQIAVSSDSLTVTYTYDPVVVPEPSAMLLLGFGVIALGTRRQRSRYS